MSQTDVTGTGEIANGTLNVTGRLMPLKGCVVSVSKDGTRASIQRGGLTVFVR